MTRSLYTSATSMGANQFEIDTISNNIANLKTTAFKKQRAETADLFYHYYKRAGANGDNIVIPNGVYVGAGVAVQGVSRILTEGPPQETNNDYHVAIIGKGYFKIEMPDGSFAYTRAGNFQPNQDGQIVTQDGYAVSPAINIPLESINITIAKDGIISVIIPGTIDPQEIGRLDMVNFINEGGLEPIGNNLFRETVASGTPIDGIANQNEFGYLRHKWLEGSNVNITTELTDLITAHRAYESSSKIMQISDEILQLLNQTIK